MTWKQAGLNTLVVAVLAAAYVGFRLYQRQASEEEFRKQREAEHREKPLPEIYKSEKLEILGFYVSPRRIDRGGQASLCYGVLNAKSVKTDPDTGDLSPSMSRCVTVSPAKTTTYTLKAVDAAGAEKTAEAVLAVK
jgi:hypothetical protein